VQAIVATPQQLADQLALLSAHINRTASPDMFRVLGELGMAFTQMKALFILSEHEQLSVKDIAGHLAMSLPAMSRSVDGLVQRGYVARKECASDRRSRLVTLLPAGRDVLERVMAARGAALVEFASELSDAERDALHTALLPIAERLSSP
jgi:DNA-binding MarR family transcriptional regulator